VIGEVVVDPLGPDDLVQLVLEQFFGRASIVVFMWLLITAALGWIAVARHALRFRDVIARMLSFVRDDYGRRTGKVRVTLALAGTWAGFYLVASFITQIWAGYGSTEGLGGGFTELISWSALFGVLSIAAALLLLPSNYEGAGVFVALFAGYVVGLIYGFVRFVTVGLPKPGDWWIAPAASCCLILVAASYARLRTEPKRRSSSDGGRRRPAL
jgi:hypothetical protein